MTQIQIHTKLTGIFRDVFDDPALVVGDTTVASDVDIR